MGLCVLFLRALRFGLIKLASELDKMFVHAENVPIEKPASAAAVIATCANFIVVSGSNDLARRPPKLGTS